MEKKIMPLLRGCENSQALVTPAARPGPSRGMHSDRAPQPSALDFQPPRPPAHPPPQPLMSDTERVSGSQGRRTLFPQPWGLVQLFGI